MANPTSFSRSRRIMVGGQKDAAVEKRRAIRERRRVEKSALYEAYAAIADSAADAGSVIFARVRPDAWNVC